ncbi:MAG: phosphoglycerate mutase [Acidimicrobiaceae bacterium]|nr:phosphoglycerate mutase [Acidimicrobiaceae bacterium]
MANENSTSQKNNPAEKQDEKSTILVLVRHGNTATTGKVLPGRARGLDLSDDGKAQAEEVADRISTIENIAAIYASPLERAQQTAAPLGKRLNLEIRTSDLLYECDFGDWTGQELKELYKLPGWNQVQRSPSLFRFPNGESFVEMAERMSKFVELVQKSHRGQVVVAFSHADPIKTLLCSALGMHLDMFQRLVIATCSVSAISFASGGTLVLGSNWQKDFSIKAP